LYVFYAGHAFTAGKKGYLTCSDSQLDDLVETSVPVKALLDVLRACKAPRTALFLDARGGLPREGLPKGAVPHLAGAELADFFKGPARVALLSCAAGEESHAGGALRGSAWAHHLVEALEGKAPLALEGDRLLHARSLQEHLARELPRTLRT